jgi:hypothetical protein
MHVIDHDAPEHGLDEQGGRDRGVSMSETGHFPFSRAHALLPLGNKAPWSAVGPRT